jgi:hypothetical protein
MRSMGRRHFARQAGCSNANAVGGALARLQDPKFGVSFELLRTGPHLCVGRSVAIGSATQFTCYASFESEEAFSKWSAKDEVRLRHPHLHNQLLRAAGDFFAKVQASQGEAAPD